MKLQDVSLKAMAKKDQLLCRRRDHWGEGSDDAAVAGTLGGGRLLGVGGSAKRESELSPGNRNEKPRNRSDLESPGAHDRAEVRNRTV
jgi:hypothetical protein